LVLGAQSTGRLWLGSHPPPRVGLRLRPDLAHESIDAVGRWWILLARKFRRADVVVGEALGPAFGLSGFRSGSSPEVVGEPSGLQAPWTVRVVADRESAGAFLRIQMRFESLDGDVLCAYIRMPYSPPDEHPRTSTRTRTRTRP
jgi:hypothetical protein